MSAEKPSDAGSSEAQAPPATQRVIPPVPRPIEQLQRLAQLFHAKGQYNQAEEIYKLILELRAREQNKE